MAITVTIKRPRDGADDDQEPSAGTDRGPKEEDVFEAHAHQKFEQVSIMNKRRIRGPFPHPDLVFNNLNDYLLTINQWNKSYLLVQESVQPWLSNLARRQDPRESFDELTDTTFDFQKLLSLQSHNKKNWTDQPPEGRHNPHDLAESYYPLVSKSQVQKKTFPTDLDPKDIQDILLLLLQVQSSHLKANLKMRWRSLLKSSTSKRLKATTKVAKSGKKKPPAQGLETLSEIALSEAQQMKIVTKRSKTQFHCSHASGSGVDEGTGVSPGVLDVPTYGSKDEQISWKSTTESDNDSDDFVHPKFSTHDEEKRQDREDKEEEGSDLRGEELDEDETNEKEEVNELYRDVNVNLEGRDTEMTDALLANVQTTQVIEDTHVIITTVTPEFEDRVKALEDDFSEFKQTNLFTEVVSSIPALVDAYETDKDILETYGDTVTLKRRQDDEDEDEEPSAGSNQGPKEEELKKDMRQLVQPKEKTSKSTCRKQEGGGVEKFTP
ncbi:hypothetical protein Tco_0416930 [Tanacetum coccineum]